MSDILLITNIPSPYRHFLFRELSHHLDDKKLSLDVWFLSRTECDRNWSFEGLSYNYCYRIYNSMYFRMWFLHIHFSLKFLLDLIRTQPKVIIVGGIGSPLLWIVRFLNSSKVKILWVESNLNSSYLLSIANQNELVLSIAANIRKILLNGYQSYIVPGQRAVSYLDYYLPNQDKHLLYLPNLIDPDLYHPCSYQNTESTPSFLSQITRLRSSFRRLWLVVGRLAPQKGILEFLSYLPLPFPSDTCIIFAGDGHLSKDISNLAGSKNINIALLGNIPWNDLLHCYANSDICILPSIIDPSPLVPIEAIAMGKPLVISSYVGNSPEVLRESVNGFIFNHTDDFKALHGLIKKIYDLPDAQIISMGDQSRTIFLENFSPSTIIDSFISNLQKKYDL